MNKIDVVSVFSDEEIIAEFEQISNLPEVERTAEQVEFLERAQERYDGIVGQKIRFDDVRVLTVTIMDENNMPKEINLMCVKGAHNPHNPRETTYQIKNVLTGVMIPTNKEDLELMTTSASNDPQKIQLLKSVGVETIHCDVKSMYDMENATEDMNKAEYDNFVESIFGEEGKQEFIDMEQLGKMGERIADMDVTDMQRKRLERFQRRVELQEQLGKPIAPGQIISDNCELQH